MRRTLTAWLTTSIFCTAVAAEPQPLAVVETALQTLSEKALDRYGKQKTAMWASVMDLRDLSVPETGVPATKGVREWDRAVGGANFYHDHETVHAARILSAIGGNRAYGAAAEAYARDFLTYSQHPKTGLLGWGEHLYYDFWLDETSVWRKRRGNKSFDNPHELLDMTPPWTLLWEIDPESTARGIVGLRYHYQGPDPQLYFYNRHAVWDKPAYEKTIMPWIKHAALFSYSFAFLYDRQRAGEAAAKKVPVDLPHWYKHSGLLHYKLRDTDTNLVFGCLYHETEPNAGKGAGLVSTGFYGYWLFKAALVAHDTALAEIALGLLQSILDGCWNESDGTYASSLDLQGKRSGELEAWRAGYSSSSLWQMARIVFFVQRHQPQPAFEAHQQRLVNIMDKSPELPQNYTAQNAADPITAFLDHYDLTGRKESLKFAEGLAARAMKDLCDTPLPRRETGDPYYESKLGCGALLAALLRLHMRQQKIQDPSLWDWSF